MTQSFWRYLFQVWASAVFAVWRPWVPKMKALKSREKMGQFFLCSRLLELLCLLSFFLARVLTAQKLVNQMGEPFLAALILIVVKGLEKSWRYVIFGFLKFLGTQSPKPAKQPLWVQFVFKTSSPPPSSKFSTIFVEKCKISSSPSSSVLQEQ